MNKKTIKSDKTKKKICDVFIKIYNQKEIQNITIKEITEKANLNRGTFYLYYIDIYDLLDKIRNSLLDDIKKEFNELTSSNDSIDIKNFISIITNFFTKNQKYVQTLITKDSQFILEIKKILIPILMKTLNLNIDTENSYMTYLTNYHFAGVITILNLWSINEDIKKEELFNMIYSLATKGVIQTIKDIK